MALLPVHLQNYSQIRKKSFKHACKQVAVSQRSVSYRGQSLTPTMLRRMGNCPPPARTEVASAPRARAGRATQALRVLSWNAGDLGQQQWSEVKSWLSTEASQTCDILVCRKHTGRPPRRPTPLRKRRHGLRVVRTRRSQAPPWPGQTGSWFSCLHACQPRASGGKNTSSAGPWKSGSTGRALGSL